MSASVTASHTHSGHPGTHSGHSFVPSRVRKSLRILVPFALLVWATATAVLAGERGEHRRMTFDSAVHR